MRIKRKLSLRKIANEYIMIVEREENSLDYSQAVALNETAAYLIESVGSEPFSVELCAKLLMEKYEVEEEQAKADVAVLVASLLEAGIIEA